MLSAGACRRLPGVGDEEEYGTLALQIGTGVEAAWTKADSDAQDGKVFHNILVIVADKNGTVIDKVYKEYPCTGSNVPANQEPKDVESTESDWIYFINLKVGYYQVYAYANIDEPEWQSVGESIWAIEKNLRSSKDAPDAPDLLDQPLNPNRQFTTLTGTDAPARPDHCMLLTGHDELYVGVDPYIGRIDLCRPVVKFEVVLNNHTPFHLQLTDLHFNKFNASNSYLIGRKDADGHPVIPDGTTYRDLPAFSGTVNIASREQKTVYSQFLYENRIGQDYRMFATVQFADENSLIINDESGHPLVDSEGQPLSKTLTSASLRRVPYEDIRDLPRGKSMDVIAVTPNTGNGGFLGYMVSSSEQRIVFQQSTYNFEESFRSKAEILLNDKQIGSYYQLRLYKETDSDKYHLYKDTYNDLFGNRVTGTTVNGLYLKEGSLPQNYPISQEFAGSLCRFTETEASNAKSLFYKDLALKLDGNANYGNRMWTFYEIHPTGTVLKLIDRESSQVSTLTQMVRGQKLTAVMNVYYESESGDFTFSLDNAYWEDGHNPKHTFE